MLRSSQSLGYFTVGEGGDLRGPINDYLEMIFRRRGNHGTEIGSASACDTRGERNPIYITEEVANEK